MSLLILKAVGEGSLAFCVLYAFLAPMNQFPRYDAQDTIRPTRASRV
jgi:hypothetical protein